MGYEDPSESYEQYMESQHRIDWNAKRGLDLDRWIFIICRILVERKQVRIRIQSEDCLNDAGYYLIYCAVHEDWPAYWVITHMDGQLICDFQTLEELIYDQLGDDYIITEIEGVD